MNIFIDFKVSEIYFYLSSSNYIISDYKVTFLVILLRDIKSSKNLITFVSIKSLLAIMSTSE